MYKIILSEPDKSCGRKAFDLFCGLDTPAGEAPPPSAAMTDITEETVSKWIVNAFALLMFAVMIFLFAWYG